MVAGVILELLFEIVGQFVLEVIGQFVMEVIGDALLRPLWRRFGSERKKRVFVGCLVSLLAFGAGGAWGAWRAIDGATSWPASIWSSLAMAAAFAAGGWWVQRHPVLVGEGPGVTRPSRSMPRVHSWMPWTWRSRRLEHFAALNLVVAAGIVTGFMLG